MKRKVIKQGHNTLTVTLPSIWAKRFNLEAGSEIDLIEKENGLFITTEKSNESKKTRIDITGMDIPTIWKYLMGVYREGYDELKINFTVGMKLETPYKFMTQHRIDKKYKKIPEKKNITSVLQGFIDRFIGWEIVEHGKNFIIVKDMGETTGKQFDNSLRRVFLLIESMAAETHEAVISNKPELLEEMHDIDINLDKFHDYCIRILNKNSNFSSGKTNLIFASLYLLELIGDEFKNIAQHLLFELKDSKFENLKELSSSILESIKTYKELYYKYDISKVEKLSKIDTELYLKIPTIYKRSKEDEKEAYHHLRMISRYINALTELRIEIEFS